MRPAHAFPWILLMFSAALRGQDPSPLEIAQPLDGPISITALEFEQTQFAPIGVTRKGTEIPAWVGEPLSLKNHRPRIVLVGGLDRSSQSTLAVIRALSWWDSDQSEPYRQKFDLSAVSAVYPGSFDSPPAAASFPPTGTAYSDAKNPEAIYLWRWLGMAGADWVVDVRHGQNAWKLAKFQHPKRDALQQELSAQDADEGSLASALAKHAACETGTIPAAQVETSADGGFLKTLLDALQKTGFQGPSPSRQTLQKRLSRSPLEAAQQLSKHYGHDLNQVAYIPALALVARLQLGELTDDPKHQKDVERIVKPYFDGQKNPLPKSGSTLSGRLVFTELARRSQGQKRERYLQLAHTAADLGLGEDGAAKRNMPFHNEMSDALFMGGPILAEVGQLTGREAYFDACSHHFRFMQKRVLRKDGLYRHSPLDEAAWGRGNGFPALGLALALTAWPQDRPDREVWRKAFQSHLQALKKHQSPSGAWRQVIDRGAYREFTCTCMITFAMMRGVRMGWLKAEDYEPAIEKAWAAILMRTARDGRLVDVCTGTGKQKNLRAYYDRKAILGKDARGGAMALLAAVERAKYEARK